MGGGASQMAPGRLVVRAAPGADAEAAAAVARSGGLVTTTVEGPDVWVVESAEELTEDVHQALLASGHFEFVQHDMFARRTAVPDDPDYAAQWHLSRIAAAAAWDVTTGSGTVTIAVVDSGVDPTHPDLASKLVPGWNFIDDSPVTSDLLGHGTMVAGTAAASTNNAGGVAGVSWGARIMPLVVLDGNDFALYSDIMQAIVYAADRGVRIVNISLAGETPSSGLQTAVDYAWARGTLVIASAGNNASTTPNYPAACDRVIAVSATGKDDARAGFSNLGDWVDVAAPGTAILTTMDGSCYGWAQGTSFSSPITAGVAALILSVRPDLTVADLAGVLLQSADDLGPAGFDESTGWGRVNAAAAVSLALTYVAPPPPPPDPT